MDVINPPLRDQRHVKRYQQLVRSHMHQSQATSSGPSTRDRPAGFAASQAAWRFFNNGRVEPVALAEPLRSAGCEAARHETMPLLLVHDWSHLSFGSHASKPDLLQRSHRDDVGYDLATALLVSGEDGSPLAPMQMHLAAGNGIHSSSDDAPDVDTPPVDQVQSTMACSSQWDIDQPLVHVIDRECDSVGHFRAWDDAGHWFLVRGDDRSVQWGDAQWRLAEIVPQISGQDGFRQCGQVTYRDQAAWQYVADTTVTLHRPAKHRRNGKQQAVAGRALPLRFVISRVCNQQGEVLATWLLLTNVPADHASAETIAHWYHWRWQIESFFKLLKSHGHQIEHWQQQSAEAIFRRLLVAAMACVCVWNLQCRTDEAAEGLKHVLVQLSGRQTKRAQPVTAPSLLSGLFVLLPLLELLQQENGDLTRIQNLAAQALPLLNPG
jgi:hypothetical protein